MGGPLTCARLPVTTAHQPVGLHYRPGSQAFKCKGLLPASHWPSRAASGRSASLRPPAAVQRPAPSSVQQRAADGSGSDSDPDLTPPSPGGSTSGGSLDFSSLLSALAKRNPGMQESLLARLLSRELEGHQQQQLRSRQRDAARRQRVRRLARDDSLEALTESLLSSRAPGPGMVPTAALHMRCYYTEQEISARDAATRLLHHPDAVLGQGGAAAGATAVVKDGTSKDHVVVFMLPPGVAVAGQGADDEGQMLQGQGLNGHGAAAGGGGAAAATAAAGGGVRAAASAGLALSISSWDEEMRGPTRGALLYDYGAVAFINCTPEEEEVMMLALTGRPPPPPPLRHREETTVVVRHEAKDYYAQDHDCTVLKEWNYANLEMIARVLGQSTGMSYYNARADLALQGLHDSIDSVEKLLLENVASMNRHNATQLMVRSMRESSHLFSRLVFKLRVMERSNVAWESSKHDAVWQGLREDYEVLERFELLEKKIQEIKEQSHLLMDLHVSKVGERYEFIITALIAIEIMLGFAHIVLDIVWH